MRFRSRADAAFAQFQASGDPGALARCFDLTARALARVARHLAGDPHRAEDLLQTTYLVAIERRDEYRPEEPVLPWLLGILANRARATVKREARRPDPRQLHGSSGELDPAEAAAWGEVSETLRAALRALPSPYREVMTLHVVQGMNAREIGDALGVPAGTVRTQIVRGFERLRSRLPGSQALRGLVPMLLPGLGGPSLGRVRRIVFTRAGLELPSGIAGALLGGVLMAKTAASVLAVAVLFGVAWWLWPAARAREVDVGRTTVPTPAPAAADAVPLEAPPVVAASPQRDALSVETAQPMLVVQARRADGTAAPGLFVRLIQASEDGHEELHERHLVTDADGRARADVLPEGLWTLLADRGGSGQTVELESGRSKLVEITLPPGVRVTGRVVDEAGRPVPGARLWISSASADPDRGVEVASTDPLGTFVLEDVAPGRMIAARADGYLDSSCVLVEGPAGTERTHELALARGGGVLVLRVVDAAGAPVARAAAMTGFAHQNVMRVSGEAPPRPGERGWTDAEGRLELRGSLGKTPVWVRAAGFAPWTGSAVRTAQPNELRVVLAPGASVLGRVRDLDGSPVAHVEVELYHHALEPGPHIAYLGPDWGHPLAFTDAEGAFTVRGLPPGRLTMSVESEGRSARVELELHEGEERVWDAVLGNPERIEGFVRDAGGAPLAGWKVWLRTRVPGAREPGTAVTDVDGSFVLEPCDDVSYRLVLRASGSLMSAGDHELADVRPGGPPLEIVVPDEHRATAGLTGLVQTAAGVATGQVFVSLQHDDSFDALGSASSRLALENGRFSLEPVQAGRYRGHLSHGDEVGIDLGTFTLEPDRILDLGTFVLPGLGSVALEVLDEDGSALSEGRFVLHVPGSNHGDVLQVTGGKGHSRPLSAGTYELAPFGGSAPLLIREIEVAEGDPTPVTLRLPHSVQRVLRYPPMERDVFVRFTLRNGAGLAIQSGLATYPSPTGYERAVRLVPDDYTLEVAFEGTSTERLAFTVEDHDDLTPIVLPDPR